MLFWLHFLFNDACWYCEHSVWWVHFVRAWCPLGVSHGVVETWLQTDILVNVYQKVLQVIKTGHKSVYSVTTERAVMFNLSQHIKVKLMCHVPLLNVVTVCVDKLCSMFLFLMLDSRFNLLTVSHVMIVLLFMSLTDTYLLISLILL